MDQRFYRQTRQASEPFEHGSHRGETPGGMGHRFGRSADDRLVPSSVCGTRSPQATARVRTNGCVSAPSAWSSGNRRATSGTAAAPTRRTRPSPRRFRARRTLRCARRIRDVLGQVPAAVAAHHQPLAAVVHHHAARRFDLRKIGTKERNAVGIGRNDCDAVVRFENFRYLRS